MMRDAAVNSGVRNSTVARCTKARLEPFQVCVSGGYSAISVTILLGWKNLCTRMQNHVKK